MLNKKKFDTQNYQYNISQYYVNWKHYIGKRQHDIPIPNTNFTRKIASTLNPKQSMKLNPKCLDFHVYVSVNRKIHLCR